MISLHYPSDKVAGFRCANTIIYMTGNAEKSSINLGHDSSFFKERSDREGMTVVSVLLGAAVEVGVGSNPKVHLYFSIIYI